MKLTEAQVSIIIGNIEKFTFTDFGNNEVTCKNVAIDPGNIYIEDGKHILVVTCDVGPVKAVACYVDFDPGTLEVLGIMDECQVDGMIDDKYL